MRESPVPAPATKVVLLISALALVAFTGDRQARAGGACTGSGCVEQHLSLVSNPTTTIDLTWTDTASTAETVSYGTSASYGSTATEASAPTQVPGESDWSHHVQISGLSPGATYHYAPAGSPSDHTFKTEGGTGAFSFVAWGDQGSSATITPGKGCGGGCGTPYGVSCGGPVNVNAPADEAAEAGASGATLGLYLGDCSYANGGPSSLWDAWFKTNVPMSGQMAWQVAVGNHDENSPQGPGGAMDAANFYGRFHFPAPWSSSSGYYSFDYEGVHFIVLNADIINSAELSWLRSDLSSTAAQTASWRIVALHQPPYSSSCIGGDSFEANARSSFVPIFDSFAKTAHVDLVLQGHRHNYERTYMIQGTGPSSIDTTDYDAATKTYTMSTTAGVGTIYVTEGGGGIDLMGWTSATPPAWSASRRSFFSWLEVDVSPTQLVAHVHDTEGMVVAKGSVWETWTVTRSGSVLPPDAGLPRDSGVGARPDSRVAGREAGSMPAADGASGTDAPTNGTDAGGGGSYPTPTGGCSIAPGAGNGSEGPVGILLLLGGGLLLLARRRKWTVGILLVAGLAAPPAARADHLHNATARRDLDRGLKLLYQRQYRKAIGAFEAGYQIESAPVFLVERAEAERQEGQCQRAIHSYRAYLGAEPEGEHVEMARKGLRACGADQAEKADAPQTGDPEADVAPITADDTNAAPSRAPTPSAEPPAARDLSPWYADGTGDALVGAGVAAGIAAGVLFARAGHDVQMANFAPTYPYYKEWRDAATKATDYGIAFSVAAAAAAGLGVWHYLARAPEATSAGTQVSAVATPQGMSVSLSGAF